MTDERAMPEGDMQAAELALGVLDGEERAAALRRLIAEPGFAREVAAWREWLAQFFADWPDAAAPESGWQRIEATLDGKPAGASRGTAPWRVATGAFAMMAASLLAVVVARAPTHAPVPTVAATPILVAAIAPTPDATGAPIPAVYEPRSGALRIAEAVATPRDRDAELWVIPAGGKPRSLGVLRRAGRTDVRLLGLDRAELAPGATIAVTREPLGGSPSGQPTGPILFAGKLARI